MVVVNGCCTASSLLLFLSPSLSRVLWFDAYANECRGDRICRLGLPSLVVLSLSVSASYPENRLWWLAKRRAPRRCSAIIIMQIVIIYASR